MFEKWWFFQNQLIYTSKYNFLRLFSQLNSVYNQYKFLFQEVYTFKFSLPEAMVQQVQYMVLACMILVYAPKFGEAACFCPLGVLLV
jgi:hypothetical protein